MDKVEELIHQFKSEEHNQLRPIDSSEKTVIVQALEDFADEPRVIDFFLSIIADEIRV